MATHSSILAWEIPWTEEPGLGSQKKKATERLNNKEIKNFNYNISTWAH